MHVFSPSERQAVKADFPGGIESRGACDCPLGLIKMSADIDTRSHVVGSHSHSWWAVVFIRQCLQRVLYERVAPCAWGDVRTNGGRAGAIIIGLTARRTRNWQWRCQVRAWPQETRPYSHCARN